jgi:hypothetical protein
MPLVLVLAYGTGHIGIHFYQLPSQVSAKTKCCKSLSIVQGCVTPQQIVSIVVNIQGC